MAGLTAVVPVSPIPAHPDTAILAETLDSIRHHLPTSEIIVMFDGVRPEQEHMRADYDEFTRRALWMLDNQHRPAFPILFDTHHHQVGMLRNVLDEIRTDLMLFVESDTPLHTSETIDWAACTDFIQSDEADVIRYYHESSVPPEHDHLMQERRGQFIRTIQFSARPHLASVDYYRRILADHFTAEARTFTEDVMHGVCQSWPDEHKLWIYAPEGETWLRSYHLDGRAGGPKFDEELVF